MAQDGLTIELLRGFSPLDGLKGDNLEALAKKATIRSAHAGEDLFKQGDRDKHTIYVLEGAVDLLSDEKTVRTITGGSHEARHPLAPILPRRLTARASGGVRYISLDSDLLDVMLTWDQTGSYQVAEFSGEPSGESDDWMTTLLQTKAFHRIPAANIQAIFMRMERRNCKAGDVVIKQGSDGDFFYAIVEGRCAVTRETPLNKAGIKLAELTAGDTFGEEALISGAKRNATVTMLTDGALMRLGKEDFQTLLNEPMLKWLTYDEALNEINKGARWLDVRLPSEFDNYHQEGALNIPLYFIRLKLKSLEPNVRYVVCCDTGRRSSAGAFILSERGFEAYVLKGGLTMSGADG